MQNPNQFNQFMTAGPMGQFPGPNPNMMGNFPNQMNPQFQQFNTQQMPNPQMMQFQGGPGQMPQMPQGNFGMGGPQGGPGGPGPNMQQNMGPPQKQRLIVKLENNERGFYSTMLTQVDPEELGKMDGKQLAPFFKRSGLPVDMLKKIWIMASSDGKTMDKEDFYVALRLIAYAQNNIEVSPQSILQNLKAPLPKLQAPPKKVEEIPAPQPTTDMNLINASAGFSGNIPQVDLMGGGMSMQPPSGFNTTVSSGLMDAQMSMNQPHYESQGSMNVGGPTMGEPTFASEQLPDITSEHLGYYERMYAQLDPTQKGIITQDEAKDIFGRSGLPNELLYQIWMFCDSGDKGCLDKPEFMLALHLIAGCKKGIPLPEKLPLKYDRFLKDSKRTLPTKDYLLEKVRQSQQENQALMGELGEPQHVPQPTYHEPVNQYEHSRPQVSDKGHYGSGMPQTHGGQTGSHSGGGITTGMLQQIEEHHRELVTAFEHIKDTNNRVLREKQDDINKLNTILMNSQAMLNKLKGENDYIEGQLLGGEGGSTAGQRVSIQTNMAPSGTGMYGSSPQRPSMGAGNFDQNVDFQKEFDGFDNNFGNNPNAGKTNMEDFNF